MQRVESYSNDVWLLDDPRTGPTVLRVCWRGDRGRLGREAALARHLPASIRYPEQAGDGLTVLRGFPLSYSRTRQLRGMPLAFGWPALTTGQRRSAVAQLAGMMRELHRWTPPAQLAGQLCDRRDLRQGGLDGLLGADLTPLPLTRAITLAEHAMGVPFIDPGLMAAAIEMGKDLSHLEPVLDDPARHGLIHGDIHLSNLWWPESGALVLLDFEWARFGPPLLDLQWLCEQADSDVLAGSDTHPVLLRWLEQDYPEIFRGPELAARMRLYTLANAIRDVIVDPPGRPAAQLPHSHSLSRLRRLVDGQWPAAGSLPECLMT